MVDGKFNYLVDLSKHKPGKFTLYIDGVQKEQFYASDELVGESIFGLIDIFRDESVPPEYQFTNPSQNHDVVEKSYTVEINNRKTFWRYYVVLKYRLKDMEPEDWPEDWPNEWSIECPSDPPQTVDPQPGNVKTVGDGMYAVPFVFEEELPLQQDPIKEIKLKRANGNVDGSKIKNIDNLPNPSIATIVPDVSLNRVYSEIFVYV